MPEKEYYPYEPQKTQEFWIAQAWFQVFQLSLKAHKSESDLSNWVNSLENFVTYYLPPEAQEKLQPLFENISKLKVNGSRNPISGFNKNFGLRLEIAKEISREVKNILYDLGLMVESRGGDEEVEVVFLKSDVEKANLKGVEKKRGVVVLDDREVEVGSSLD
jgi:predicted metalloprotease with PDZ domain